MKNPNFQTQLAEANNTVQAKGLVLSQWDKSICKADKSRFKALCAKDGFWFSLGEICLELLKQSGGNRTDSALLKDANLHTVAKQRRKEAMDFVTNFDVIIDEVKQIEDKSVQSVKTAEDLALDVLLQVELNNISLADFEIAIANAIGMVKSDNEVVPFDVAV